MTYTCGNSESPRGMDILTSRRDDLGKTTFGWLLKKLLFENLNAFLTRWNVFAEWSGCREPCTSALNLKLLPGLKWVTSIMSITRAPRIWQRHGHLHLPLQPWIFRLSTSTTLHRLSLRARYAEKPIGCLQAVKFFWALGFGTSLSWLQNFGTISKNVLLEAFLGCKDTGECEDWEKIEGGFQKRWSNWRCCLSLMVCAQWIPVRHWWNFLSSNH